MQEFDENEAVARMIEASGMDNSEDLRDTALEILDLVYDYYEGNGDLNVGGDEDDDDDPEAVADYIVRQFGKNAPAVALDRDTILKMVEAEMEYEQAILE